VPCANHSCFLDNDDDDEMMVRDCVCQVDTDEKVKASGFSKAISNLTAVLINLNEMFQNQIITFLFSGSTCHATGTRLRQQAHMEYK
jgi:hypothetical protein